MPQFFVSPDAITKDEIQVRGKDARHLQDVLRLDVGDWVVVCDGIGSRYRAEIVASRPLNVQLRRGMALPAIHLPCHVTLAAAVIRPQRFDWLVEKAFELGCRRLIPLTTERTVTTYIKDADRQRARWSEIALSAAKQSSLPWTPEVSSLTPLADVIRDPGSPLVYCWEGLVVDRHAGLDPASISTGPRLGGRGDKVTLLIGPEGGFSPAEHEHIMTHHPRLLSLGPLILRSETAAVAALIRMMS